MIRRVLTAAFVLAVAACSGHDLPKPEGSPFAFNPGLWQPTRADLGVITTAGQP